MIRALVCGLLALGSLPSQTIGPSKGSLVIAGGALRDQKVWDRFIELAGGPNSKFVVIPTAGGADDSEPPPLTEEQSFVYDREETGRVAVELRASEEGGAGGATSQPLKSAISPALRGPFLPDALLLV